MTSPASRLHAAATRLRALAEAATPGPWWVHRDQAEVVWYGNEAETYYLDEHAQEIDDDSRWDKWAETTGQLSHGDLRRTEDSAYIAAMSPPVALAVADWLDVTAETARVDTADATVPAALAVADAINEGDTHE